MNVSENTADAPSTSAVTWPNRTQPVAPWWHTALLIVIILGVSVLSSHQSKLHGFGEGRIWQYAFTIAWECVLALITFWGLRLRRTPLREVLGIERRGISGILSDIAAALVFWIVAISVLAAIAFLLRVFHLLEPRNAVIAIAPQNFAEICVWIVLCTTAGIVEEFVFRGYMLQQFSSLRGGNIWIGIVASSLLFGAGHGYEGFGGMIAVTAYGAMFALLAIRRRSLRAGMIAHAWHDSLTGIVLAIFKHSHLI
jgi:hypothetical protein